MSQKGLIALIVFFVLLTASGALLAASGNWENPFAAFGIGPMEGGRGGRGEGFTPPERSEGSSAEGFSAPEGFTSPDGAASREASSGETTTQPMRREGGRGGESQGIQWSQLGAVLFDIWFLFAASGAVIVIGLFYQLVRKQVKARRIPA